MIEPSAWDSLYLTIRFVIKSPAVTLRQIGASLRRNGRLQELCLANLLLSTENTPVVLRSALALRNFCLRHIFSTLFWIIRSIFYQTKTLLFMAV